MEESPEECGPTLHLGFSQPLPVVENTGLPFSYYFETHPDVIYGTTLENPYATIDSRYSMESAREYGHGVLRAMMRFEFSTDAVPHKGHREFQAFCESLNGSFAELSRKAEELLKQADLPGLYRAEINLRLAREYALNGQKDQAKICNDAVLNIPEASMKQKRAAAAQNRDL